ncbi:MAG: hypothetical protein A3J28_12860 [Acidobacteria bacterium RIFCSPLOWO2_12_FULL_60_22]|nr:MAG: hypothetical protein A3J28_12860 [Acidobacteria bacterium RIFCSPLOWO2_12_FULL_60_22]
MATNSEAAASTSAAAQATTTSATPTKEESIMSLNTPESLAYPAAHFLVPCSLPAANGLFPYCLS